MTWTSDPAVVLLTIAGFLVAVALDILWIHLRRRKAKRKKQEVPPAAEISPRMDSIRPGAVSSGRDTQNNSAWQRVKLGISSRGRPALFLIIILLSIIPPFLVFLDRWVELPEIHALLSGKWNSIPVLGQIPLPSYFLFIYLCVLALVVLIGFFPLGREVFREPCATSGIAHEDIPESQLLISRRMRWISAFGFLVVAAFAISDRRIPGWELALVAGMYVAGWLLRDCSLDRVRKVFQANEDWLFPFILVHVALVTSLAVYYSAPSYLPICVLGLALSGFYLFRHRRGVPAILWIFTLGLIFFSININSWWVSVVGDEYGFYENARWILEKAGSSVVAARLFDERGVYGQNPFLASVVQAAFLRIFGIQSFGWRFSSIYLSALSIPLFYIFFKEFIARRTALLACFFLAVSHYLVSYSKIGYGSLQSLFTLALALATAVWAVRSGRQAAYAVAGAALAMNFYAYGIALVSIPLVGLLIVWYDPPISRMAFRRWAVFASAFGMLCFPLCFQPDFWRMGFQFTIFGRLPQSPMIGDILQTAANRIITSLFSYLYAPNESHFVVVAFVDVVTGFLVGIGLIALLHQIRRNRFSGFFLLSFVILLTVAGIIGSPKLPSVTRLFVILPWWVAAAAIGWEWIFEHFPVGAGARGFGRIRRPLLFGIVLLAAIANLLQATVISYTRWIDRQPFESQFLRLAEAVASEPDQGPFRFVIVTYFKWNMEPFLQFRDLYPRSFTGIELEKIVVEGPILSESALPILTEPNSIVIVVPTLPKEWREGVGSALLDSGAHACALYTAFGKWEFDFFYSGDQDWICLKAGGETE